MRASKKIIRCTIRPIIAAALTAAAALCCASAVSLTSAASETGKIYRSAETWMYASLDPHVDYQGWMDYGYGLTEMLFHIEDDGSIVPFLAEDCVYWNNN